MVCSLKTEEFCLAYSESQVDQPVLWENHCHARFEIIAVAEGDINVILEGKDCRLRENRLILIPPLSYHSVVANEKGIYRRVTASFDRSAIPQVLRRELAGGEIHTATLTRGQMAELESLCRKEDPLLYAPLAQSLMVQIFYKLQKAEELPAGSGADEFLEKSIRYIDSHLKEKILLDDLAAHTSRSKSSFCHLFEEKMNISPKQYILQKKLALANKLISEGVMPTVAAAQIGYDNYSNFYRLYRRQFGQSPTRRKN